MAMLKYYNLGENVYFALSWKKFTFFFLVLSYLTYNCVSPFCKSLENIYQQDRTWNKKFNRLMSTHERQRELKQTMLSEKLPDKSSYKKKKNMSHNISVYSHVKRNESNNIDIYLKNYKRRYSKKNGLSKLECYYENKVFKKFCDISDIGKNMKYDEKSSKSFFLKKYGIALILFALIPALGLIYPILFGPGSKIEGLLGLCPNADDTNGHLKSDCSHKNTPGFDNCTRKWMYDYKDTIIKLGDVSYIFSFIMIVIILLVLFYILIKIIKYEKIKAGKGKMNIKEYYRFCKDIL